MAEVQGIPLLARLAKLQHPVLALFPRQAEQEVLGRGRQDTALVEAEDQALQLVVPLGELVLQGHVGRLVPFTGLLAGLLRARAVVVCFVLLCVRGEREKKVWVSIYICE